MTPAPGRRLAAALLLPALLVGSTSCTSKDDRGRPSATAPTATGTVPEVTGTRRLEPLGPVRLGRVVGEVRRKRREPALVGSSAVVDRWLAAAYLEGSWPRRDFRRAFPGFTPGARTHARRDRRQTSNAAIGAQVDEVVPRSRSVRVDLLGRRGRVVGATARVRLVYRTQGRVEDRWVVRGRLLLTKGRHGWQVFGYDVARGRA